MMDSKGRMPNTARVIEFDVLSLPERFSLEFFQIVNILFF